MPGEFLDSNVLIYAFTNDPRAAKAQTLLTANCVTSVQGLNEFANVARRKLNMSWLEVNQALASLRVLLRAVHPIDLATHDLALTVAERHSYSLFDALMIASALQAGSTILYSEDMQHDIFINSRLRIVNPFIAC
ncbi:MAG TPA: PIN domain-containing protein [Rhizomicrobium sp.]|nr:PIN domain-containing protein [Rhizomicrobium sp.]